MKHSIKHTILFVLALMSSVAFAQNIVTGTVSNEEGPLPGATVTIAGTSKGVSADFDGKFSINAAQGDVLIISYIGYTPQEVVVATQANYNITLQAGNLLDEVIVTTGYGTQRKSDLTGSIAVVDVEDAKKTVTYDVAKMLQGQAAGVTVQSSGEPGGFVNIKIRGISSFNNNNPLFVIDGVLVDDPYDFAPGDIESIQVLKDASAAAIYGSRAANGVVIINTKKGKSGEMGISLKSVSGVQYVGQRMSLANAQEYQYITNTAQINAGEALLPGNDSSNALFINDVDTDWQDAAFRTATIQNHSLSINGGGDAFRYNFNVDYFNQEAYIETPQDYERISTTLNLNGEKNRFKYGLKLGYTQSGKENFGEYLAGWSNFRHLLQAIPTMPVYDENRLGGYGGADNLTQRAITLNVIGYNNLNTDNIRRNRFISNFWGEYELFDGLKYKLNVSADILHGKSRRFIPPSDLGWYYITTNEEASLTVNANNRQRTIIDNLLSYSKEFGQHKFDALAGYIQMRDDYSNLRARGTEFEPNEIAQLEYAANQSVTEYNSTVTTKSLIGRLNYSFDDRYLVTFNYRQDKTSLFSENNNQGDYFSVAGAWKISNESFINLPDVISNLKLRGGYGTLGNNTIGVYGYSSTVFPFAFYPFGNGKYGAGTTSVTLRDPNVKWEDTETVNAALEASLFDNSVSFSAEYYKKTSTDLLASVPIPLSTGSFPAELVTNAAEIYNEGFEFQLGYNKYDGEFTYSISANASTLTNRVVSIGLDGVPIDGSASRTEVGRSVGELYAYEAIGIFQNQAEIDEHALQPNSAPGDVKFRDVNGDGLISDLDRTFQGVTIPKYSFGLNFNSSYKNFDLSLFFQGAGGHKAYNQLYAELMLGDYVNHHTDMLNHWSPTNTDTNVPRPVIRDPNQNNRISSRFIEDASFVRLQNIELGYNVPVNDVLDFVESARLYVSGQNLLTITKYKGFDPDFNYNDGLFSRGFDNGSWPNPQSILLGLNLNF